MNKEITINLELFKNKELGADDILVLTLLNQGEYEPIKDLIYEEGSVTYYLQNLQDKDYIKIGETLETTVLTRKGKELFLNDTKDDAIQVLEYFNIKLKEKNSSLKGFSTKSSANIKFVSGRLSEGYTVEDCKKVIDTMISKWYYDPKMRAYLRPETLFGATKFQGYINQIPVEVSYTTFK